MAVIGVVAVWLFGKRLPEVGQSLGKGIVEFKKGNANFSPRNRQELQNELWFFLGLVGTAVFGFFALLLFFKPLTKV